VFLGAFAELRRATIICLMCACPLACNNSAPLHDFRATLYLRISRKSVQKIQGSLKCDKNICTLHEDLCTFITICRWIVLKMRNVWNKSCRDNQNTFLFKNFIRKSCRFKQKL